MADDFAFWLRRVLEVGDLRLVLVIERRPSAPAALPASQASIVTFSGAEQPPLGKRGPAAVEQPTRYQLDPFEGERAWK